MEKEIQTLIDWCGSQSRAAEILGVNQSTISRILRKKVKPHGSTHKILEFIVDGDRIKEHHISLI